MEEYIFRYRSYGTSQCRFQIFQAWALAAAKDESDEARRNTSVVEGQVSTGGIVPGPGFEGQMCWADFVEKSSVVVPCL